MHIQLIIENIDKILECKTNRFFLQLWLFKITLVYKVYNLWTLRV